MRRVQGTVSDRPEWVERARALSSAKAALPPAEEGVGWERIAASFPPVLEGDGVRALLAPLVAAVAWAGAMFRELTVSSAGEGSVALDPFALLMRLLAVGLTVRALLLLAELVSRLRVAASAPRSYLVLAPRGLYVRGAGVPGGEAFFEREDIVAIAERGQWQGRRSGRRWSPVFVIGGRPATPGGAPPFLALPPMFMETAGVLAEHLTRWRGTIPEVESPTFPEPPSLGSQVYDDAAAGRGALGSFALKHGRGWLRAGPYASAFLAVVALDGYLRATSLEREALGPLPVIVVCAVATLVPLGWIVLTRREISPRRGLAMLLTPSEVILRTRAGVLRTRWSSLQRVLIDQKTGWSILEGIHPRRSLVLKRKSMEPIYYEEAFLGVPCEVAQAWLDGHRRGVLPLPAA